jgi:penicillin-binding protein 1A
MMSRLVTALISIAVLGLIGIAGAAAAVLLYFGRDLPDYSALANYQPPIVTRAYASDGRLLAEFANEKRVFVPIESVPPLVVHAFLSAEDKNFFTHKGIDPMGVARAIVTNLKNAGSDKRSKGASTITQQVARNFLLTDLMAEEKGDKLAKYRRKVKEILLSFRIEQAYTKNQILGLYLNEIFLGAHAYGVAAAALEYFDKPLEELSIEEAAFLAALPKAPNNYQPDRSYAAAFARRNYVIDEMTANGHITKSEADLARARPITVVRRSAEEYVNHPYFAEEVRRKLQELYGDKGLYEGGLIAKTTMIPAYQKVAEAALRHGLIGYDSRFGLHSVALAHIDAKGEKDAKPKEKDKDKAQLPKWAEELAKVSRQPGTESFERAVVLEAGDKRAVIGLANGKKAVIPFEKMSWAHKRGSPAPVKVSDVLKTGDVWLAEDSGAKEKDGMPSYWLRQIPEVSGGIVVMDPHTGRVFAIAGGFSYELSEFDRAMQAQRQPGSAFKPFVYVTALENGFTPATLILDAPIVLDQGPGLPKWKPQNYHHDYNGPTPMRVGLEKSLNLMTIRIASYIGIDKIVDTVKKFGIMDNMPPYLSYALGSGETTLWRMVSGYSVFVNGGKKVTPTLIDRIQDRNGKTIYVHDNAKCDGCGPLAPWNGQATPELPDTREQIADPRYAYQMVSMMEGVVQRGTAMYSGLKEIGFPVAGKTGTTNDSKDTWFIGFTPDLVVGAYVGFDEPKAMGAKETGSRVAAPIVKEFMEKALKDITPVPFRVPPGIRLVDINERTGTRPKPGDKDLILEAFVEGTEPTDQPVMFNGKTVGAVSDVTTVGEGADTGLGGLY